MSEFTPTDEQYDALDLFHQGDSMVVEALAGTGKTSTLKLLAESTPDKGQYIVFNRAMAEDARGIFPGNVDCSTAHSLAYAALGHKYRNRLGGARQKGIEIADRLNVDRFTIKFGAQTKTLQRGFLGSYVMRALGNFCRSIDTVPDLAHFPYLDGIDLPTGDGKRTYANNDGVRKQCLDALRRAWDDVRNPQGELRFEHDHYLKMWALSEPQIPVDFILFDEAQDADPVIAGIVAAQKHAQLVYVGDENQAIYEWRGAVDAMSGFDSKHRRSLQQSFRFGAEIASFGNVILDHLDTSLRLRGTPSIPSRVGPFAAPDAILCRTNAQAVQETLNAQAQGRSVHIVGGPSEVLRFAQGAKTLQEQHYSTHPELACFGSWDELEHYVETDPNGADLKLMVSLMNEFGIDKIVLALDAMPSEAEAETIISTVHKAKGRQWEHVVIAPDFAKVADKFADAPAAQKRLLYVACTRAQLGLDDTHIIGIYDSVVAEPLDLEVEP